MALTRRGTGCRVAEAIRVRDLCRHRHHMQGPTSFSCWTRQRCSSALTGRPELIGNIQQRHPSVGPLLCIPGRAGNATALTQGITADLTQPARLNRCSHTHQIEGIGATCGITTDQRLKCAVTAGRTVGSRVVEQTKQKTSDWRVCACL